ncbi:hypothetical protein B7R21_03700 [Subtercola boreus]|uniref:Uncharacterized protein n=1 Tax=Subtercola boreus TaxID=120213 RepID=A0A3E0W235_9MICO|nr:hypothetical protein [Subtercola boreus]RFA15147.1 hypothetical protein B7R21_03700 [Subtercola boreus]
MNTEGDLVLDGRVDRRRSLVRPTMSKGRRNALRVAFALAILLLPAEMVIQKLVDQPYPGIYQPSFAGTPVVNDILTAKVPLVHVTFADASVVDVPFEAVLPDSKLLDLSVFNSAFQSQIRANSPETVAWLKNDLEQKFPGRTPTTMVVEFQTLKIDITDPSSRTATTTKTVTVDLQEGAR